MKYAKYLTLMLFCAAFCLFSCKKEKGDFPSFPLQLALKDSLGLNKLTWNKLETSDFIEYVVVRSLTDSIPDFTKLTTSQTIVARITDITKTEFLDPQTSQLFSKTYYRVFLRLQNRNISSPQVSTNSDIVGVAIPNPNNIFQSPTNAQWIYVNSVTANSNSLFLYDLDQEKIMAQSTVLPFFSQRIAFVTENGNNPQIVLWNSASKRLYFYDAQTLAFKSSVDLAGFVYGVTGTNDGYVVAYTDDFGYQLKTIRVSDGRVLSTLSTNNIIFSNFTVFLEKIPNNKEILLYHGAPSQNIIYKSAYGADGTLSPLSAVGTPNSSASPFIKFSNTGKYVCINNAIFNTPLNLTQPLLATGGFTIAFNDAETLTYMTTSQSALRPLFNEIALNPVRPVRTFSSKINTGSSIFKYFTNKNKLVVLSSGFISGSSSNILVYQAINL